MSITVQVARDPVGEILDVRSEAELCRRPWSTGDHATFEIKAEQWTETEYDEHRAPNAVESKALVDATIADLKDELARRGFDPKLIDGLLDRGL